MVSDGTPADQNKSGYNGAHVDLHRLRLRLQEILGSIYAFESPIRLPPVLDASLAGDDHPRVGGAGAAAETAIPGLRGLEESVRRDLDVLTKVSSPAIRYHPSPGLRIVSTSSFWTILGTKHFLHFQRMRRILWPCGMRF